MGVKEEPPTTVEYQYASPRRAITKHKNEFWGIMVLFGSFMCRILQDGYLFAIAVFIVKWQDHFSAGAAVVGLVGSLTTAFMLMICKLCFNKYLSCIY